MLRRSFKFVICHTLLNKVLGQLIRPLHDKNCLLSSGAYLIIHGSLHLLDSEDYVIVIYIASCGSLLTTDICGVEEIALAAGIYNITISINVDFSAAAAAKPHLWRYFVASATFAFPLLKFKDLGLRTVNDESGDLPPVQACGVFISWKRWFAVNH